MRREAKEVVKTIENARKRERVYTQFRVQKNSFLPMGAIVTQEKLDPGMYQVKSTMAGILFEFHELNTDELLRFDDSRHKEVLGEIKDFWQRKNEYVKLGFTHKRGVLLRGEPGVGKSCLLKLVMEDCVARGDVVFIVKDSYILKEALAVYRDVEPDRHVLIVMEDIDRVFDYGGEHPILELLDGDAQTDGVLFLFTTNYYNKLSERIRRPGRIDKIIEIKNPPAEGRLAYLKHKLGMHEDEKTLEDLADKTDGFSFAQLREFLVSVYCLGSSVDKAVDRVRNGIDESFLTEELLNRKLDRALNKTKVSKILRRIR